MYERDTQTDVEAEEDTERQREGEGESSRLSTASDRRNDDGSQLHDGQYYVFHTNPNLFLPTNNQVTLTRKSTEVTPPSPPFPARPFHNHSLDRFRVSFGVREHLNLWVLSNPS